MTDIITHSTNMEIAWSIFFALTAIAGWQIIERIERSNMLNTMTQAHINWHTIPSFFLKISGAYLALVTSQHAVTGDTVLFGLCVYIMALTAWGISIGALLFHVAMESQGDTGNKLFK